MFIIISYGSYKFSLSFSVVFQASTGKKNLTGTGNLMLQIQFKIYILLKNDQDPKPGESCCIEPLLAIFLILQQKDLFFVAGFSQGQQIPFLQFPAVSCIVLPRKMLDISMWVVVLLYPLPNALGKGYNGKTFLVN